MSTTKKFRITYETTVVTRTTVEVAARDEQTARDFVERIPEEHRTPSFFKNISHDVKKGLPNVVMVAEVES